MQYTIDTRTITKTHIDALNAATTKETNRYNLSGWFVNFHLGCMFSTNGRIATIVDFEPNQEIDNCFFLIQPGKSKIPVCKEWTFSVEEGERYFLTIGSTILGLQKDPDHPNIFKLIPEDWDEYKFVVPPYCNSDLVQFLHKIKDVFDLSLGKSVTFLTKKPRNVEDSWINSAIEDVSSIRDIDVKEHVKHHYHCANSIHILNHNIQNLVILVSPPKIMPEMHDVAQQCRNTLFNARRKLAVR